MAENTRLAWTDRRLVSVRSAPIAAHLRLSGHPLVQVRHDRQANRTTYLFEPSAQPALDRIQIEMDSLKAEVERAEAQR